MKKSTLFFLVALFCLSLTQSYGQITPKVGDCPVYSVSTTEINVGSGAGQVYPTISVSTQNNCTNYTISNSYSWMSYEKNGLSVTIYVTSNNSLYPRSGCFNISQYCVNVIQGCGLIPGDAGTITGAQTVCQGQTEVSYSVPAITNATAYRWTLPSGASITSGANTNSITVSFSTTAISGNISVSGTNSCNAGGGGISKSLSAIGRGGGAPSSLYVTVNPLPTAPLSVNSSKLNICQNAVGTMILTAVGGSGTTLEWRSGNCVTGGFLGTGNNLTVPVPAVTTNYYARWVTGCGNSSCAGVTVTVYYRPYVSITQTPSQMIWGLSPVTLKSHVLYPYGTGNYWWTGPNGFTSSNKDADVGYVEITDPNGPYYLTYTSDLGCVSNTAMYMIVGQTSALKASKDVAIQSDSARIEKEILQQGDLSVFPNPTTGIVNIRSNQDENFEVFVYNRSGRELFSRTNISQIDLKGYPSGIYFIKIKVNGIEKTVRVLLQ